jgi:hypothetical protein
MRFFPARYFNCTTPCWAHAYFEEKLFLEEKPRIRKRQMEGKES